MKRAMRSGLLAACAATSMMFSACGGTQELSGEPYVIDGKVVVVADGRLPELDLPVAAEVSFGRAGNRILFAAERGEVLEHTDALVGYNLWSAASDGSDARRLVDGHKVLRAQWSPARQSILYSTTDMQVFELGKDGQSRLLVDRAASPALSPDGQRLAYARLPEGWSPGALPGGYDLHVLELGSGQDRVLTQGKDDAEPVWSLDGRSLLFLSGSRTGLTSFWRVEVDGTRLQQVTNVGRTQVDAAFVPNPSRNDEVRWSSDGRRLLYGTDYSAEGEVMMLELDENLGLRAAHSLGEGHAPMWTDDGHVRMVREAAGRVSFVEASATGAETTREVASTAGHLQRMTAFVEAEPVSHAAPAGVECKEGGVGAMHGTSARFRWPLGYYPSFTAYYDNDSAGGIRDWKCGTFTYNGHRGTDIGAGTGNAIYSGDSGVVNGRVDGCPYGSLGSTCGGGFGNYVKISHGSSWFSVYAHMTSGTLRVSLNQSVGCGVHLGNTGSSGNSSGPHLHFEVQRYGYPQDDPFAGSCSGPESFWTNQNGGTPTTACH